MWGAMITEEEVNLRKFIESLRAYNGRNTTIMYVCLSGPFLAIMIF